MNETFPTGKSKTHLGMIFYLNKPVLPLQDLWVKYMGSRPGVLNSGVGCADRSAWNMSFANLALLNSMSSWC
jgi:hypothetical protein